MNLSASNSVVFVVEAKTYGRLRFHTCRWCIWMPPAALAENREFTATFPTGSFLMLSTALILQTERPLPLHCVHWCQVRT
jgi:hypothetical protein